MKVIRDPEGLELPVPCVRDIMSSPVLSVRLGDTVRQASRKMARHSVSGLAVRDGKGRTVGVVTASDIVRYESARISHVMAEGAYERLRAKAVGRIGRGRGFQVERLDDEAVSEIMTAGVVTVPPGTSIGHVAWLMSKKRIHRVFIEEGGRVVGIVTALDLAGAVGRTSAPCGQAWESRG